MNMQCLYPTSDWSFKQCRNMLVLFLAASGCSTPFNTAGAESRACAKRAPVRPAMPCLCNTPSIMCCELQLITCGIYWVTWVTSGKCPGPILSTAWLGTVNKLVEHGVQEFSSRSSQTNDL